MRKRKGANAENATNSGKKPSSIKIGRYLIIAVIITAFYKTGVTQLKKLKIVERISPAIELTGVEVSGFDHLDSALIVDVAGVDSGTTLLDAELSKIKERVLELGGVKDVSVKISFKKEVLIKVVEREPKAFVVLNGELYFTDETGAIWRFVTGSYREIPVVVGVDDSIGENKTHYLDRKSQISFNDLSANFNASAKSGNRVTLYDFSNPDMVTLQLNGLEPAVRVKRDVGKNTIENIEKIIELLKKSDVTAREYIDLSYNNVAYIK